MSTYLGNTLLSGSGNVTPANAITLSNKTLGNLAETIYTVVDGVSVDLDPANGPTQLWTLGDNRTPTATNFADGQVMTLLVNDGTDYAITWTTMAVTWLGGSAPTLETSGYTAILLFKIGGVIYGKA